MDVRGIFSRAAAADQAANKSQPVGSNGKEPLLAPKPAAAISNAAVPEKPAAPAVTAAPAATAAPAVKPAAAEPEKETTAINKPVSSLPNLPKPVLEKEEPKEGPGQKEALSDTAPVLAKGLPGDAEVKHGLSAETAPAPAPAPAVPVRCASRRYTCQITSCTSTFCHSIHTVQPF